jgi:putative tricarboxylic transport membrane protein
MKRASWACIAVLALAQAAAFAQPGAYPGKRFEMVAAGNPGGGIDAAARAVEAALRETRLVDQVIVIKNMSGAAGDLAKTYINQKKGDPYFLYIESNRIYVNKIVGTTPYGIEDVTPLGRLATEYLVWAVRADSPYKSAREILDKIKADPASIVFGIGSAPSNDQMNILRPAMAAGADVRKIRIVTFKSGGNLMIQLLGAHVPVISTSLSEAIEQLKAGQVRLLAVSAPQPLGGELAGVPTWRSLGIDVAILHWRGVFAPPGIPAEAVRFWDQALGRMVKTEAWKNILDRSGWYDAYADSATFLKDMQQERAVYTQLLTELGMAKDARK